MKKVDLWASDSDEMPATPVAAGNEGADSYKTLYLAEVQRRKELEELVAKQEIEIRKLKAQLSSSASARPISLSSLQSDSEDDLFGPVGSNKARGSNTGSPLPLTRADASSSSTAPGRASQQAPANDSAPQPLPRSVSPLPDPHWDELAQAEQERRKQARRGKVKSIRLPLKAAVQQLAGKPVGADEPASQSTEPLASDHAADVVDDIAESLEDARLSVEKKQKLIKKRAVRHDTQLRRLNVKSLPRDFGGLANKHPTTPLESVPEARPHSTNDLGEHLRGDGNGQIGAMEGESEDSGWSSGEEEQAASPTLSTGATTTSGTVSSSVPPAATAASSSSSPLAARSSSSPMNLDTQTEIDALIIHWARGKQLVDLLNTVQDIAPAESIPPQPCLYCTSPSADIRRNYLRVVRYCHPDKVAVNKTLSRREQAVLEKIFTVLSESYAAFASVLS